MHKYKKKTLYNNKNFQRIRKIFGEVIKRQEAKRFHFIVCLFVFVCIYNKFMNFLDISQY